MTLIWRILRARLVRGDTERALLDVIDYLVAESSRLLHHDGEDLPHYCPDIVCWGKSSMRPYVGP